ncbi:MAG: hypothetical protein WBF53_09490, partial [Litorimonas sp.]
MPNTPNPSLVSRLVRAALLWTVPALLTALVLLTWFYRDTVYTSFDDPLEAAVTDLIAAVEVMEEGDLALRREPFDPAYQQGLSGRYWMVAAASGGTEPLLASRSLLGGAFEIDARDRARLAAASGEA